MVVKDASAEGKSKGSYTTFNNPHGPLILGYIYNHPSVCERLR